MGKKNYSHFIMGQTKKRMEEKMKVMKFVLIWLVIGGMILISACDENTTEPEPNIPYSPIPADNALNQAVALTLSWNYDESTATFDLYLGTSEEEITLLESDIITTSYNLNNLQFNTQYFWKVVAKLENEEENESPIWNFTTDEKYTFELFGNYTNDNDNNPQFIIDEDLTDPFISFDGFPECIVLNSNSIQISLNNLSISGEGVNYAVESVNVEEFVNDNWQSFVEFSSSYQKQTEIVIVLVLDASNSLGYQFNNVKEFAKEFVNIIFNNSSEAMVGIAAFSTEITVFPISNNHPEILNNIDSIEQGEYTKMYDAMMEGINLLNQIVDADGYALVTFTDGIDNYSTTNYTEVIFTLENSNIKSFTMGLEGNGGIDETILEALAVNSNEFEIVSSVTDLQNTFQLFAQSVSNVYRINYIRNNQIISEPREIKFIMSSRPGVSNPVDYYEDFEDGSFQNWTVLEGDWEIINPGFQSDFCLYSTTSHSSPNIVPPVVSGYGIYELDYKIPSSYKDLNIFIKKTPELTPYSNGIFTAYMIGLYPVNGDSRDCIVRIINGESTVLYQVSSSSYNSSLGDVWNHARIVHSENGNIEVFVNGILHMSVNDNWITDSGSMLIRHHQNGYIDNLSISQNQ